MYHFYISYKLSIIYFLNTSLIIFQVWPNDVQKFGYTLVKIIKIKVYVISVKKQFEAKGGNTSNLISHLRYHHPNIHLEFKNLKSLVGK